MKVLMGRKEMLIVYFRQYRESIGEGYQVMIRDVKSCL